MKVGSKTFKKILSGVLAFALIVTSLPLIGSLTNNDTVSASSGSDGSGGGSLSGGGSYDNYEVIAIYPSKLKEASSAKDLEVLSNRYYSNDFPNYPVLFRVSKVDSPDVNRNRVMLYDGKLTPSFTVGSKYINQANLSDSEINFFYNSIKNCISKDEFSQPTVVIDAKDNMGETLNKTFGSVNKKYWTEKNSGSTKSRYKEFFSGYSKAFKQLYPDRTDLADIIANCTSFTVERYWGLSGDSKLYSASGFSALCVTGSGMWQDIKYRENDAIFAPDGPQFLGATAGNNASFLNNYGKMWRADLRSIYPAIYDSTKKKVVPALVDNNYGSAHSFAGWAFYELTHGGSEIYYEDKANVRSQVTYNAYLGDTIDSEGTDFGKNGLVSSDLVSISASQDYDLLPVATKFVVDKSIKLDTPYTGANFDLSKLNYRVTNAQGSRVLNTGGSATDISKASVSVGSANAVLSAYQKAKDVSQDLYATTYTMSEKYMVTDSELEAAMNKKYPNSYYGSFASVSSTDYSKLIKDSSGKVRYISWGSDENTGREKLYIKQNGTWYYCPTSATTNLLIQVRADYLKKYSETEVGKIQTMQSYLLAKQFDLQEDFVKDNIESLRTMIDAYPTTVWGAVKSRTVQSSVQADTGSISYTELQNMISGYFRYNVRNSSKDRNEITPVTSLQKVYMRSSDTKYDGLHGGDVTVPSAWNSFNNVFTENNVCLGSSSGQISSAVRTLYNGKNVKNKTASGDSAPEDVYNAGSMVATSLLYHGGVNTSGTYVAGGTIKSGGWITKDKTLSSGRVQELAQNTTGYKATDFSKLVAKYTKTYNLVRGKNASVTAPNVASWTANGLQATYSSVLGLNTADIGRNVKTASAKSATSSRLYDYGFARLGLGGKIIYNNSRNPSTLVDITVIGQNSNIPITTISNFKNSSVDIPIRVQWEQYFTGERKSTETSTIGSVLKVDPEVTMWYESTGGSYGSVVTAGDYIREIPIIPYNTLEVTNSSSDPVVTGTSTALDARAKTLASRLADENTPVFYSGSGITLNYEKVPSVELTSYMLDIDDSRSNLKSAWGNTYNAETAIRSMVSNANAKADVTPELTVNGKKLTLQELKNRNLTAGNSTCVETWYLTVKGGEVTKVSVNGVNYGAGSFGATTGKPAEIAKALKEMKLIGSNNILSQVFAKGAGEKITDTDLKSWLGSGSRYLKNGWYFEDTSVLVVKKFKTDFVLTDTTISDKLPMNLGPQTPADRNKFFSDGYTATADLTVKFNLTIAGTKLSDGAKTDRVSENKVDFIVPDVSVTDSYGV